VCVCVCVCVCEHVIAYQADILTWKMYILYVHIPNCYGNQLTMNVLKVLQSSTLDKLEAIEEVPPNYPTLKTTQV